MKNFFVFTFVLFSILCFAQSATRVDKIDFKASYRLNYKKFASSDKTALENQVLILKSDGTSYFMFETMMGLDSIQKVRSLDITDIMLYRSPLYYLIERKGNKVTHFELIGNDLLKYSEQLGFDWKLVAGQKIIREYNCKKATVDFEGRQWTAWYSDEIPLNAGPYKFYGLPGLILEISDSESLFNFSVESMESGNFTVDSNTSNYFISDGDNTIQDIKKEDFHDVRKKFYKMSMNESIKYMNRGEDGVYSMEITTLNGEKVNPNRKPKTKNFIEKYD
ncbi:GLPGLI family protein [Flavobacterium tegetincola]|uniref:GLPGLI family protein n=1 Tax=Flavobacterium tegetincola TaxID=150172 RepID=UPI0004159DCF|nr:GLPGLI family protein [Flavobacterium tegetincola]